MRRALPIVALLAALPGQAAANTAFCNALRQVVAAAQSRFDSLPASRHAIPGSLEERRGVMQSPSGQPHGVLYAVMFRHDARQSPNPARERFAALQREVGQCLADARFLGLAEGRGGATASWQTPYALVGLRRDDGGRELPDSIIELSVASRW